MGKKGVIRTKGAAQDGNRNQSDGTVQEVSDSGGKVTLGSTYSFTNQTLGSVQASTTSDTADVTFDTTTDPRGNTVATNVQPIT